LPVRATLPDPSRLSDEKQKAARDALDYMGLAAGRPIEGTPVDQVFLGSCTNGRIEDLRAAAAVLAGRSAKVPGLVSPGSALVRHQAEQEGLDQIFREAGLEWSASGCSMCVRHERRHRCAGQALRIVDKPELSRAPRPRCPHASHVTGNGRSRRCDRHHHRCSSSLEREGSLMAGWSEHQGQAVALPVHNIDTDQLIPARFMSTPRSEGYGQFLLHDLRRLEGGSECPELPA
jgi:hypothetical protein